MNSQKTLAMKRGAPEVRRAFAESRAVTASDIVNWLSADRTSQARGLDMLTTLVREKKFGVIRDAYNLAIEKCAGDDVKKAVLLKLEDNLSALDFASTLLVRRYSESHTTMSIAAYRLVELNRAVA